MRGVGHLSFGIALLVAGCGATPERTLEGAVCVKHVAFEPGGERVGALDRDGFFRLWDLRTGAVVRSLRATSKLLPPEVEGGPRVTAVLEVDPEEAPGLSGVRPLGRLAFLGPARVLLPDPLTSAYLFVVSITQGEVAGTLWPSSVAPGAQRALAATCVAAGPGGEFAAGWEDGSVRTWTPEFAEARVLSWRPSLDDEKRRRVEELEDAMARAKAEGRPDIERSLLTADHSFELGDFQTLGRWRGNRCLALAFSPDGTRLAAGGNERYTVVWSLADGEVERRLDHGRAPPDVLDLAFSPDGHWLATLARDGKVRLFSLEDGALTRTIPVEAGDLTAVAFAPRGDLLAVGHRGGEVTLLRATSGARVRSFRAHRYGVLTLAFSPEGDRLVSGGDDDHVHVWRLEPTDLR